MEYLSYVNQPPIVFPQNIYVVGFSYPVVPKGEARIRVQISASHTLDQINQALEAFKSSGEKFNII